MLGYSEIEAIDIETGSDININCNGTVTFNGGQYEGIVIAKNVADKLNLLEQEINNLKDVFTKQWAPVVYDGGASLKATIALNWGFPLKETTPDELRNDKIKH